MFSWLAIPGILASAAGVAAAWVVFAARPDRAQNRRLATFLFLYTAGFTAIRVARLFTDDRDAVFGLVIAGVVPLWLSLWAFLRFLATLETPLAAPFRWRFVDAGAFLVVAAMAAWQIVEPHGFVVDLVPFPHLDTWSIVPGPRWNNVYTWQLGVFLLGLACAIDTVRRTVTGTAARDQARWYAFAFGCNEAITIAGTLSFFTWPGYRYYDETALGNHLTFLIEHAAVLTLVALLAYGILRHQLFDIDLKIKWTISRGTLAAAFVAVFFVASEAAQQFFSGAGGPVAGLVAAGLLVFALAPLQRLAERVSDRAMPNVRDTPEYRTVRKRDVYRAAVESALQDGVVTDKERDVLATLAERLGLSPTQARTLEREAQTGVS